MKKLMFLLACLCFVFASFCRADNTTATTDFTYVSGGGITILGPITEQDFIYSVGLTVQNVL